MDQGEEERGGEERRCVDGDPDSRARGRHDEASERGASDPTRVLAQAEDRVRRLEQPLRDGLRDDSSRSREEERGAEAVDRTERRQLPDLGLAGQQQDRDHTLRETADDVRCHHHAMTRQAVGPDPADEQEEHLRDRSRGENETEVGFRAGQVENGERERDVRERVADERGRPAEEEESELALAERPGAEAVNHGADGTRTRALLPARLSLSQLSYGPWLPGQCSREIEIVSPIDSPLLIVQARAQTKRDLGTTLNPSDRNEEAPIELEVVGSDRIDLLGGVRTADETVC